MPKIISACLFLFIIASSLISIVACSNEDTDIERFSNAYREILIVREQYADTSIANPKVRDVLDKYGYTEETFWQESQDLLKKDRNRLSIMIDSMRSAIKEEIKTNTEKNVNNKNSTNKNDSLDQSK